MEDSVKSNAAYGKVRLKTSEEEIESDNVKVNEMFQLRSAKVPYSVALL